MLKSSGYPYVDNSSGNARLYLEDCILWQLTSGHCVNIGSGTTIIRGTLFVLNAGGVNQYAVNGPNGGLEIYNCVFLGFQNLFGLTGTTPMVYINNIVFDWAGTPSYGTYFGGSVFGYNASSSITPPGTNGLLLSSNPFVNYDPSGTYIEGTSNLHLVGGSPCIDSGSPSILDLDNSRSDMGIFGGPRPMVANGVPAFPFTINMSVTPNLITVGDSVTVSSSGRIGPRY